MRRGVEETLLVETQGEEKTNSKHTNGNIISMIILTIIKDNAN